jgi:glyoxylase-like metal-dependent hydrolase (beta-lactamase superfamily II)
VTDLIFTHMHLDHVGWTTIETSDGQRELIFPNARIACTSAEWEFWHGGDSPAGPHPEFVQKPLEGRLNFLQNGEEIAPGITVLATPGHTPGHISLLIQSGDQRLYLLGDVFHGVMQMSELSWSVAFDIDQAQARATRESLYPELIRPDTLVAGNHFSDQVFGYIHQVGDVYQWEPIK